MNFREILEDIRKRQPNQSMHSAVIGRVRQEIVKELLERLQKKEKISFFNETSKLSHADVIKGIDFYVIVSRVQRYTIPLSVIGPTSRNEDAKRHPDVPVIIVDLHKPTRHVYSSVLRQLLSVFEKYT